MRKILLLLILLFACSALFSQVWTCRIGPDTLKNRSYYAYMWIPETAAKGIRGLILAPEISAEWQFIKY